MVAPHTAEYGRWLIGMPQTFGDTTGTASATIFLGSGAACACMSTGLRAAADTQTIISGSRGASGLLASRRDLLRARIRSGGLAPGNDVNETRRG